MHTASLNVGVPGRLVRAVTVTLAIALVVATAPPPVAAADGGSRSGDGGAAAGGDAPPEGFDEVAQVAREEGSVRAIIELTADFVPEGDLSREQAAAQRGAIAAEREGVHDDLEGTDYEEVGTFETVPLVAMVLSEAAVERLHDSEHVRSLAIDEAVPPALAGSVPIIQGNLMHAAGFGGEGFTVAILDTGVESGHSFFGGRVTEEACYSTTGLSSSSLCPSGANEQVGPGAGADCHPSVNGCGHGTHVAGIAAGSGPSTFTGVAPGAEIMAIQVFSRFDSEEACGTGQAPCVLSFTSDQIKALERVYQLHIAGTHTFASANMSLGGGQHFSACDGDSRKLIIDQLRSVHVATVISSGNNGFTDSVGAPSCISTAVAVGSTTKDDALSSFSNSHPTLVDVLAPGSSIHSSYLGGTFATLSGTSMAAPHVAGAWAVLRQLAADGGGGAAAPATAGSVSTILDALQATGVMITDTRPGGTAVRPRIRIADAAGFEAQPLTELDEGFEVVPGIGWQRNNLSDPVGDANWMQGNPGVFSAHAGPASSFAAANFSSGGGVGTISNWLITPLLVVHPDAVLTFWSRTIGEVWPDRLEVRVSTDGSCEVTGGASDVGSFATLLLTINPDLEAGGYPTTWTQYEVPLTAVAGEGLGCIAFRYYVTDGGPLGSNSDYIGIDTLTYTSPEPQPGAIAGTVTDAGTAAPISGATVEVTGPASATTTTGADGTYAVPELPPGSYTVTATAAGYASTSTGALVSPGETTTANLALPLEPGAIAGTVTGDDTSAPVAGASVEVAGPVTVTTTTGTDGTYHVGDLPDGSYTVTVTATGYAPASTGAVVSAGATTTANFVLEALPGAIAGTVTGADTGEPIAGATVEVSGPGTGSVTTGTEGNFLVSELPVGTYTVTVSADEYATAVTEDVTVSRAATTDLAITLQALPGTLTGVATDGETATPVAGASVSVEGPASASTTTSASGAYTIADLPPGAYTLTITADGYEDHEADVAVMRDATATVNVSLDRMPPHVEQHGDNATPSAPLAVTVSSPMGGPVTIDVVDPTGDVPEGWAFAGSQVSIDAPDATAGNPIVVTFRLHVSQLGDEQTAGDVQVLRDGAFVADCDGPAGVAQPDPCVASRAVDGDEVVITVLTSQASLWNLLLPELACPAGLPLPFTDVPASSAHAGSIACAAFRGIASGVGEGRYEPSRRVTRGQMATFVRQALEAAGYTLPAASNPGFTDVSGVHADSIYRLVDAGIVGGTSETTFNPSGFVRRAQMASFLAGAMRWATGEDLQPAGGPHFTDTEGNPHAANIDLAFELGLTAGAGEGLFAPQANVNRAPMASFLRNLLEALWPEPAIT